MIEQYIALKSQVELADRASKSERFEKQQRPDYENFNAETSNPRQEAKAFNGSEQLRSVLKEYDELDQHIQRKRTANQPVSIENSEQQLQKLLQREKEIEELLKR